MNGDASLARELSILQNRDECSQGSLGKRGIGLVAIKGFLVGCDRISMSVGFLRLKDWAFERA
jgi:hypothetical protein